MNITFNLLQRTKKNVIYFFLLLVAGSLFSVSLKAQDLIIPNRPYSLFLTTPGYVTTNEITTGVGIINRSEPFSKFFLGFNTIHGYQINKNFVISAGTGIAFYNGGPLIPLFLDLRVNFLIKTITPYFSGDGGLLINPSGGEKLFINPGAGIRYSLSSNMCINIGAGYMLQMAETQSSFICLKIGMTFKPK
jgi:hypothetical protein